MFTIKIKAQIIKYEFIKNNKHVEILDEHSIGKKGKSSGYRVLKNASLGEIMLGS